MSRSRRMSFIGLIRVGERDEGRGKRDAERGRGPRRLFTLPASPFPLHPPPRHPARPPPPPPPPPPPCPSPPNINMHVIRTRVPGRVNAKPTDHIRVLQFDDLHCQT